MIPWHSNRPLLIDILLYIALVLAIYGIGIGTAVFLIDPDHFWLFGS
jgi:hypothetical protein